MLIEYSLRYKNTEIIKTSYTIDMLKFYFHFQVIARDSIFEENIV